ncbi:MAG: ABC transporter ATP-binding protein [Methanomassiliicoccus sp.]|nr:ABC transporter ATP-binding protein [Methanomassiliicoccus sp.]
MSGGNGRSRNRGRAGCRLLSYLAIKKGEFAASLILMTVGVLSFLLISIFLGQAVGLLGSGSATLSEVREYAIVIAISAVVAAVTLYVAFRLIARVTQNALYRLRKDLFDHVMGLSLGFFDRQPIGELVSRINNDTDVITSLFQGPFGTMILGSVMLTITLVAMLLLNAMLAVAVIFLLLFLMGVVTLLIRTAGPAYALLQEKVADLNGLMEETISGERVVIAYRQQDRASRELSVASRKARDTGAKAQIFALTTMPMTTLFTNLIIAVVALVGAVMVIRAQMPVSTLVTFFSFAQLLVIPLFTIFANFNYILVALAGARRIFQILDERPDVVDLSDAPLDLAKGHVEFRDVDFSYVQGRKILSGVSFEAKPGQMIGLCGPTGAGKSTIINILTRYYDLDSGTILVDGQDISRVRQDSLRSQIAAVQQEPFLFSDTVMNNLRYGREDATDEECLKAAMEANCDEFVRHLPNGYETMLSEGGANLSQGQRQLLTIARTMIADPRMLILDEATSNVDTRTERKIQEAIRKLQEGRTSFVIAHRLSTIRYADQILVINDKRIIERGTHEELMTRRGFYYDLYMGQYKGKVSEVLPMSEEAIAK